MDDEPQGAVLRPWTIKAMPEAITTRAVAAARRRQEPVAELVTRALIRELDQPHPSRPLQQIPTQPTLSWFEVMREYATIARTATPEGKDSKALMKIRRTVDKHIDALDARVGNGHIDGYFAPVRPALTKQTSEDGLPSNDRADGTGDLP